MVTLLGNPVTLTGNPVGEGDALPEFSVLDTEMNEFNSSSLKGDTAVVLTVPSLDTPVCDTEVRRFNREAASLGDDVRVVVISMDLPFAQARWCGAAGIDSVQTCSDHRDADAGLSLGVLMKEVRLLARAAFVIGSDGIVRFAQIVPEVGEEPDYAAVLDAVKQARS